MICVKPLEYSALPGTLWHLLFQAKLICDHSNPLVWHAALAANWPHAAHKQPGTPFLTRAQILDEFPLNLVSSWLLTQPNSLEEAL